MLRIGIVMMRAGSRIGNGYSGTFLLNPISASLYPWWLSGRMYTYPAGPAIIMPSSTDLYFPAEDSRLEVAQLRHGELRVLESKFGHSAGAPDRIAEDTAFVEAAIRELLAIK